MGPNRDGGRRTGLPIPFFFFHGLALLLLPILKSVWPSRESPA